MWILSTQFLQTLRTGGYELVSPIRRTALPGDRRLLGFAFAPTGLRRDSLRAGSPSRSSRFGVSSRERRLVDQTGIEPVTS